MSIQSVYAIAVISIVHYVFFRVSDWPFHTILMFPLRGLFPYVVFFDCQDYFKMLMVTNSVVWAFTVYGGLRIAICMTRGNLSSAVRQAVKRYGRFSLFSIFVLVSTICVELVVFQLAGVADWFALHFVAAVLALFCLFLVRMP